MNTNPGTNIFIRKELVEKIDANLPLAVSRTAFVHLLLERSLKAYVKNFAINEDQPLNKDEQFTAPPINAVF